MNCQQGAIVNVHDQIVCLVCLHCQEPFTNDDIKLALISPHVVNDIESILCLDCEKKIIADWIIKYRERCAFPRDVTFGLAG